VQNPLRKWRNAIFFASGFAGLIYESIWTQYVKLFLGHAAYAQTLVLAIFMGGMAIGAALVARRTLRINNPLAVYAAIEAALGVLAFAFHPLFTSATAGYYDLAFVRHLDGAPFLVGKWSLAALLILPQSILLGATFPLVCSAVLRLESTQAGHDIAIVAPPYLPYPDGWRRAGVDFAHVHLVDANPRDALWASEQCLRAGCLSAVLSWPMQADDRALRRLQVAADTGGVMGFVFRDVRAERNPSPAALRIAIDNAPTRLRVIKCRGAMAPARPVPFPAATPAAA